METYDIHITRRTFGQTRDDWHAKVYRRSDRKELWFTSPLPLWAFRLRLHRILLDRAFKSSDRYEKQATRKYRYSV